MGEIRSGLSPRGPGCIALGDLSRPSSLANIYRLQAHNKHRHYNATRSHPLARVRLLFNVFQLRKNACTSNHIGIIRRGAGGLSTIPDHKSFPRAADIAVRAVQSGCRNIPKVPQGVSVQTSLRTSGLCTYSLARSENPFFLSSLFINCPFVYNPPITERYFS